MYQIQDEVPKALSALGTGFGSIWKVIRDVQGHFTLEKEIKAKSGRQGALFFICYTLFQYIYQIGLVVLGIAGLGAVLGGALKLLNVAWAPPRLVSLYERHSIQLVVCAALWCFISIINAFSWMMILLLGLVRPSWLAFRESAGWYNLKQFAKPLEHPKPLFLNRQGIERLADGVILRLMRAGAGSANFAAKPQHLAVDERANAALFGCFIEREYKVQRWGHRDWAPFYAAVSAAQHSGASLFSPQFLTERASNIDFYGAVRQAVNQQLSDEPELPDSPVVMSHVSKAVQLLATKYNGSARNLALGRRSQTFSIRRAFERARHFQPLDRESMVPQFLKLAVRWDVWPGIEVGNFIYPYAHSVALLILENRALVTLDKADKFAFKDAGELYAYRETMRRITKTVEEILSNSNRHDHREYLRGLTSAGHPVEWEIAARVDFALWSWSTEIRRANGFQEWEINNDNLIERKAV